MLGQRILSRAFEQAPHNPNNSQSPKRKQSKDQAKSKGNLNIYFQQFKKPQSNQYSNEETKTRNEGTISSKNQASSIINKYQSSNMNHSKVPTTTSQINHNKNRIGSPENHPARSLKYIEPLMNTYKINPLSPKNSTASNGQLKGNVNHYSIIMNQKNKLSIPFNDIITKKSVKDK